MALLVTVGDVIESMGLNPELEQELDPSISRAIQAAQARLETEIGTFFERLDCTETFKIDSDKFSGILPEGLAVLRLRNGFVQSITEVKSSDFWNGEFAAVDSSLYRIHADHGLLFLDPELDGKFVQVRYESGFFGTSDCPQSVKQAILYFVPTALKLAQPGDPEAKRGADQTGAVAQGITSRLYRPLGIQFHPMFYSQTVVEPPVEEPPAP